MFAKHTKDPDAVLDYGFDWSDWLVPGDTISASTWTVFGDDSDLSSSDPTHTGTETVVWLSGGTLDSDYQVTNHITTTGGREDDRTLRMKIAER